MMEITKLLELYANGSKNSYKTSLKNLIYLTSCYDAIPIQGWTRVCFYFLIIRPLIINSSYLLYILVCICILYQLQLAKRLDRMGWNLWRKPMGTLGDYRQKNRIFSSKSKLFYFKIRIFIFHGQRRALQLVSSWC